MGRFRPGKVVGYLIPSKNSRDGFIIQSRNPQFKAWGKLNSLKLLPKWKWKYVTLTEQADYGNPLGILYLSRKGTFFNIRSKQKGIMLIGWTKNLRRFIDGKRNRVSIHQRTTEPPQLQPLTLKIKKWGKNIYYWIGVEGSRYGLTLTYNELTHLLTNPPTSKEHYGKKVIRNLGTNPQLNGTIKIGKLGSQRKLTTTAQNLRDLLDKHFITPRIGGKFCPLIPKLQGWAWDKGAGNPLTLTKTIVDKYKIPNKAKITLQIQKKDIATWGADLVIPYTKTHNLIGYIETTHSQTGGQMRRWAKREIRKIARVMAIVGR